MSIARIRLLALTICRHVVQLFQQSRPAQTPGQIAKALDLPPSVVDNLADLLVKGKILVWIDNGATAEKALQPARDIHSLTLNTVIAALEDVGSNGRALPRRPELEALSEALQGLHADMDRSEANRPIMDF